MKKHVIYLHLLLILTGLIGISNSSNAQIEDFMVGSTTRKMLVYAPSGIIPGRPLLISMHGYNQDINYQKNQTKWELIAKENNFVVVYPGGINNSWDISGTTDIDFILAIIDEMADRYSIDRNRVYLSGFSMGGMMTYYAATQIADKIAAFAPVSGYLMQGPDTNSSRPIPIIHTHGTADDVVGYSGVAACLDAWVARNGCPADAQITKPYPEGSLYGDSKSYWGPGIDSVEVVLITLNNKGHWHSIQDNGVNSSQEIWDFCKKFSLDYGISRYKAASVYDADPKLIQVRFTKPIKEQSQYEGFAVKVDGVVADIDTVIMADSLHLAVFMADSILKNNDVHISYSGGNVLSVYDKALAEFGDTLIDNQLYGSSPKFTELWVTGKGDTLIASFNKKMLLPADISTLALKADYNGEMDIPLIQCEYLNADSATLVFPLGDTVYADYTLVLAYSGNNIASLDSGLLKSDPAYIVTNNSEGLPVQIISAIVYESAMAVSLEFSKPMYMVDSQISQLSLRVNGEERAIKEVFNLKNTIRLNLFSNLYYGDSILITYTPGDIFAADKGALEAFTDVAVVNPLAEPVYSQVPGTVEAENYSMQLGTDTETTSDAGGGLNVGWTETDDWLVYAIENNTDITEYQIKFRLAAQSSGAKFDYYIDDVKIGTINVPSTGDWQKFTSVIRDISIPQGQHYLKIVVVTGGFNINYFDVQESFESSLNSNLMDDVLIYPNPASNNIVISSANFQYNQIEILDITGKSVYNAPVSYLPELHFNMELKNGVYLLRISNGESFRTQRIEISN
ncbi:MAG: carbohydrate-binding protein [Bacteroidales bacterium]|nr:carbohydrate-binding protein [Bacteroidales bacterium]